MRVSRADDHGTTPRTASGEEEVFTRSQYHLTVQRNTPRKHDAEVCEKSFRRVGQKVGYDVILFETMVFEFPGEARRHGVELRPRDRVARVRSEEDECLVVGMFFAVVAQSDGESFLL